MAAQRQAGWLAAAIAAGFGASVHAADWDGFYAGASAGFGWGKADTTYDALPPGSGNINSTLRPQPAGVLFGAQAGYNLQSGNVVYGVETDFSLTGMSDKETKAPIVVDGTQIKILAWYDNEWGYANRLVELARKVVSSLDEQP